MTLEQARALLGASFVDFAELGLPRITTPVLHELRAALVLEQSSLLTEFGIRTIDAELEKRA